EVLLAVAVEIAHRHGKGDVFGRDRGAGGRPEPAAAVPQQDRHVVASGVGDGEVLLAVTVEVADCDKKGASARGDWEVGGQAKPAAAVAQQDGNVVVPVI